MAEGRKKLPFCLAMVVLGLHITGNAALTRNERAVAGFIAQFSIDKLLSIGLDQLMDQITENDYTSQLEDILESLSRIEANFDRALTSIEEIKELFTVSDALKVERKLQVYVKRLYTIVEALKIFNDNPAATKMSEQYRLLKKDIEDFKRDVKEVPDLLVELHQLIMGNGIVSSGKTSGLACQRVDYERRQLESATAQNYNINAPYTKISSYRDSLMKLQVSSFQMRNTTCSSKDLKCQQEAVQLEEHLQAQNHRFEECFPKYLKLLSQRDSLTNIHLIDPVLKKALYTKQNTSIVANGDVDWDRIDSPQDQGLRCLQGKSSEVWSLVKSPGSGYYLKDKSGCFLSFDKPFIDYEETFPTFWADSDKIDRREFLICLPSVTRDTVSFLLYATSSQRNASYHLKEVTTKKYLHVHEEKTSVHEAIDRRLVLVLLLDDQKSNPWIVVPTGKYKKPCKETSMSESSEDNIYIWIIGGSVGGFVLVVIGICFFCCCIRRACCNDKFEPV